MVFKYDEYTSKIRKINVYEEQEYRTHYTYIFKIKSNVNPKKSCHASKTYKMNLVLISRRDWNEYNDHPGPPNGITRTGDLVSRFYIQVDLPSLN